MIKRTKIFTFGMVSEYEFPEALNIDRYTYSMRCLHMAMGLENVIFLPEFPEYKQYLNDLEVILSEFGIELPQIVIIPGESYVLDRDIYDNLEEIIKVLPKNKYLHITSYARTDAQDLWVNALKEKGYDIILSSPLRQHYKDIHHPQHRGGWGRWVKEPLKPSFPEKYDLPYPISWVAMGLEELVDAYRRVRQASGSPSVYIKLVYSVGGHSMANVTSEEEVISYYKELKKKGRLDTHKDLQGNSKETAIEVQAEISNISDFSSVQYHDDNIVTPGGACSQIIGENNYWVGNMVNCKSQSDVSDLGKRVFGALQKELGEDFFGYGGIDIVRLSNPNGKLVILEHNGGRLTAVHPALALASNLGVLDKPFSFLRCYPSHKGVDSLGKIWSFLKKRNLAFNKKSKTGFFPVVWLPDANIIMYIGDREYDIDFFIKKIEENIPVTINKLKKLHI